jgi:hypothetical protein
MRMTPKREDGKGVRTIQWERFKEISTIVVKEELVQHSRNDLQKMEEMPKSGVDVNPY